MIEVEVKIPIENIEKIKQKLLETGFIYQKTVVETDTYFISDHYDMRKKDKHCASVRRRIWIREK